MQHPGSTSWAPFLTGLLHPRPHCLVWPPEQDAGRPLRASHRGGHQEVSLAGICGVYSEGGAGRGDRRGGNGTG